MRTALAALLVLCCGPAVAREMPVSAVGWRAVATSPDRERLRNWREAWVTALAQAKGADDGVIAREPALFEADRSLADAMPPAGAYRCRTFKLGSRGDAASGRFVADAVAECRIDTDPIGLRLTKSGGPQRWTGHIFPEGPAKAIFLGALVLGDERNPRRYGADVNRDMAGIVTRIGERRWRLALPAPRFESKLDLIELVPAG